MLVDPTQAGICDMLKLVLGCLDLLVPLWSKLRDKKEEGMVKVWHKAVRRLSALVFGNGDN